MAELQSVKRIKELNAVMSNALIEQGITLTGDETTTQLINLITPYIDLATEQIKGEYSSLFNIPEGIKNIGGYTFYAQDNLAEVKLPSTCIGINAYAFAESGLKSISGEKVTIVNEYSFYDCEKLVSIYFPEVETIGERSFVECASILEINLPKATTVGIGAFLNCSEINTINLPLVTTIEQGAFYGCTGLTFLDLMNGSPNLTKIGSNAFQNCSNLISITLPNTITEIGNNAFAGIGASAIITVPNETIKNLVNASGIDTTTTRIEVVA